jgi:hypothetical protein
MQEKYELKTIKEAYDFLDSILINLNSTDILSHCYTNAIGFYQMIKSRTTNKIKIKYGTFENTLIDSKMTVDGMSYLPFHVWNMITINNRNIIIDISQRYNELSGLQKIKPNIIYNEKHNGFIVCDRNDDSVGIEFIFKKDLEIINKELMIKITDYKNDNFELQLVKDLRKL